MHTNNPQSSSRVALGLQGSTGKISLRSVRQPVARCMSGPIPNTLPILSQHRASLRKEAYADVCKEWPSLNLLPIVYNSAYNVSTEADLRLSKSTHTYTHTHARMHARTHTHTHTHAHTHAHTHTRTHKQIRTHAYKITRSFTRTRMAHTHTHHNCSIRTYCLHI